MNDFAGILLVIASDLKTFAVLQAILSAIFLVSWVNEMLAGRRAGKGGTKLSVGRGKESMEIFYGVYLAISGVLIAICLSVDAVKGYRIFWAIFDSLILLYVCILNPWSRNKLVGWAVALRKLEKR